MVIIMHPGTSQAEIDKLSAKIESLGCHVTRVVGENYTILGLVGDTTAVDMSVLEANESVERVLRVQEPFKRANRLFHPESSEFIIGGSHIGGKKLAVMAGPCSVESKEQIVEVAQAVKEAGATFLRGGAFKPRTSPYSFQGMGEEGLELLAHAKKITGLPIVTEVMSTSHIEQALPVADVLQIGARNMQNFELLREAGRCKKPILLKRGLSATVEEFLMAAEYIMAEGNETVILCERGIRTFETFTRNTLDLSAIPAIKRLSHLPVIVDPSHATGKWWMVEPLARAAVAVGADGLMIEVHNDPANARCDGEQSLKPKKFRNLMESLRPIAAINQMEV